MHHLKIVSIYESSPINAIIINNRRFSNTNYNNANNINNISNNNTNNNNNDNAD